MSSRFYRSIKTYQEKREANDPDIEDLVRVKRNTNNIPDGFDDIQRCYQRSWKVQRKTRWRRPPRRARTS